MNFNQYLAAINSFNSEELEAGEMLTIYSIDDEGNGYKPVHFTPVIGELTNGEFNQNSKTPNAICIN